MKLYPKCHPYWEIDGKKVKNPALKSIAYTAEGYLLPCCWCDEAKKRSIQEYEMFGLLDKELKVSNVDDIEQEILRSPEWYHFHETLVHSPENAPRVCIRHCSELDHDD